MNRVVAIVAVVGSAFWLGQVSAQAEIPDWVFARSSDGQIWLLAEGLRTAVAIYPANDEQINGYLNSGKWLVPGRGSMTLGEKPDWAGGEMAGQPGPAEGEPPVKLSGDGSQNTRPFDLRGGDYTVTWRASLRGNSYSCFAGGRIKPTGGDGFGESLFSEVLTRDNRRASGETQLYRLKRGRYYLDVDASGCEWSVEIRPQ